nr:hypothetical protein HWV62_43297 [Athelia sp. TMB]
MRFKFGETVHARDVRIFLLLKRAKEAKTAAQVRAATKKAERAAKEASTTATTAAKKTGTTSKKKSQPTTQVGMSQGKKKAVRAKKTTIV